MRPLLVIAGRQDGWQRLGGEEAGFTRCSLVLVKLAKAQIAETERVNGDRKIFTHAVLCGPYGQLFGTETFCRKYFNAWKKIFPLLFDKALERSRYPIKCFDCSYELVTVLMAESDKRERALDPAWQDIDRSRKIRDAEAAAKTVTELIPRKRRRVLTVILGLIAGVVLMAVFMRSVLAESQQSNVQRDSPALRDGAVISLYMAAMSCAAVNEVNPAAINVDTVAFLRLEAQLYSKATGSSIEKSKDFAMYMQKTLTGPDAVKYQSMRSRSGALRYVNQYLLKTDAATCAEVPKVATQLLQRIGDPL